MTDLALRPVPFTADEISRAIGSGQIAWDDKIPGFGLRTRASGRQSWIVLTRVRGKLTRITLGNARIVTEYAARQRAMLHVFDAKTGGDPLAVKRAAKGVPLFDRFHDDYRRRVVPQFKPSTILAWDVYSRRYLMPGFRGIFLDQIDTPRVAEWFNAISRRRPGAANRCLEILKAMLNTAVEWELLPDRANPCTAVRFNPRRKIERFLTEDELARMGKALEALEGDYPLQVGAVRLLLYTGCRLGEVLSLRRDDIAGRSMILRDSKTGPRRVELGDAALAAHALIPRTVRSPWLFPQITDPTKPMRSLYQFWHQQLLPRARIRNLRVHDLRHSFASHAALNHENTPVIGRMLGHRRIATTQRYMHLADTAVLEAAETVSAFIAGSLVGEAGPQPVH
jgi:integrase